MIFSNIAPKPIFSGIPFRGQVQRAILYLQPDADLDAVDYRKLFRDAAEMQPDGYGSKPCTPVNPKIGGNWMFIPKRSGTK